MGGEILQNTRPDPLVSARPDPLVCDPLVCVDPRRALGFFSGI